jgi:hypothetical protein
MQALGRRPRVGCGRGGLRKGFQDGFERRRHAKSSVAKGGGGHEADQTLGATLYQARIGGRRRRRSRPPPEFPQNVKRAANWTLRAVPVPTGLLLLTDVMRPNVASEEKFVLGLPSCG